MAQRHLLGLQQLALLLMLTWSLCLAQVPSCYRHVCPTNSDWCHRFHLISSTNGCNATICEQLNQTTLQILRSSISQVMLPTDGNYWIGAMSASTSDFSTPVSACWSQNISFQTGFTPTNAIDPSNKYIVASKINSLGPTYQYGDTSVSRAAICEIPVNLSALISDELCYPEINKCFYVSINVGTLTALTSNGCGTFYGGRLATAATADEDNQLRDFINYLPISPKEYYINATQCSPPYYFNRTMEVLDIMEPVGRQMTLYSCAMIMPNGLLTWQSCSVAQSNYLCYRGTSAAVNDDMCRGSFSHAFWPLTQGGVTFDYARQKCNGSLAMRAGLVELLSESLYVPSRANISSIKYFAGLRKPASTARTFMWNRPGFYAAFNSSVLFGTGTETFHCVVATKQASGPATYAAMNCSSLQSTAVLCGSGTVVDSSSTPRTYQDALARCRSASLDLVNVDVTAVLTPITSYWVNSFENQSWSWSDGGLLYSVFNSVADSLTPQLLQSSDVRFDTEQCAFIRANTANNNTTLNLEIGACTDLASIVCQFNTTTCTGVPQYDVGYISGTVSNNVTDSSFSVDVLNGSCPLDLTTPFAIQSAVFYTCNGNNASYLGNDSTMIQSQCTLGGAGPTWTSLVNGDLCLSNYCDTRKVINYNYLQNLKYLNATDDGGFTRNTNQPYVTNGTKVTLMCRPGSMIVKADDTFEPGGAISNEILCMTPGWQYSVATFANTTTIQVCDKITNDNNYLLKCEPIKCNTSDFKFLKSLNDKIPRTYMLQNETLNVNCSTNSSATFNLDPVISIQCVMIADYTYGYVVSNTFNGASYSLLWNSTYSNMSLDDTISAVCKWGEYLPCTRNQTWLDQFGLETTNLQTSWPGVYNHTSQFYPPNSSLTVRCVDPRVSDRYWTSIGQTARLRCAVDKVNNYLQWDGLILSCSYQTCPSADGLLPPMSMATGLKTNLSDTWVSYYNASKYPPASQILVNCSFDASIFQILYCNDSGQWVPVQYSYVNDTLDLCIGSYINCSMLTTTVIPTTTMPTTAPTTILTVQTTTTTPTSTTLDTTTVTSDSTTVTVELTTTTTYSTTTPATTSTTPTVSTSTTPTVSTSTTIPPSVGTAGTASTPNAGVSGVTGGSSTMSPGSSSPPSTLSTGTTQSTTTVCNRHASLERLDLDHGDVATQ